MFAGSSTQSSISCLSIDHLLVTVVSRHASRACISDDSHEAPIRSWAGPRQNTVEHALSREAFNLQAYGAVRKRYIESSTTKHTWNVFEAEP